MNLKNLTFLFFLSDFQKGFKWSGGLGSEDDGLLSLWREENASCKSENPFVAELIIFSD